MKLKSSYRLFFVRLKSGEKFYDHLYRTSRNAMSFISFMVTVYRNKLIKTSFKFWKCSKINNKIFYVSYDVINKGLLS